MHRNDFAGIRRAAALAILLAVPLSSGCHHRGSIEGAKRTASAAAPNEALSGSVMAPGIVEPWGDEVRVAAKEAGWIAEILVREGQSVTAGDILARLDDGAQTAGVALAQADVAEARAVLERAQRGPTAEELAQARSEWAAATARAARAAADAGRLARLLEEGLAVRADAERAQREAEQESATAASLEARYQAAVRGTRIEDLRASQRRFEAAQARLQAAQEALSRRRVVSPMAGTVLWSRYRPGEIYAPGSQALFVLGDLSRLQIRVDVDEIDAPRVALGAAASIRIDGSPEQARGRVVGLSPRMGRKNLLVETPTARNDVRIREVLVEAAQGPALLPGARVWVQFGDRSAGL